MKVWVPIDLPEGWVVSQVLALSLDEPPTGDRWLNPLGPVRPFDEEPARPIGSAIRGGPLAPPVAEPQRERWEYRINAIADDAATHFLQQILDAWGKDGWECFAVGNGAAWFKRRMIP